MQVRQVVMVMANIEEESQRVAVGSYYYYISTTTLLTITVEVIKCLSGPIKITVAEHVVIFVFLLTISQY